MAEKGKKSRSQVTDGSGGSIFKTTAIVAPVAIGGGMGISRLSKRSNFFGAPEETLPHNPARDAIRNFTNRHVSAPHSATFKDWQLKKLAGFSENIAVSNEDLMGAWQTAIKTADPSGAVGRLTSRSLAQATTGAQFIEDLQGVYKTNTSLYFQRAMSIFLEDLDVMQTRVEAGLPLETVAATGRIPRTRNPIGRRFLAEAIDPQVAADLEKMAQLLGAELDVHIVSRKDLPKHLRGAGEIQAFFKGGKVPFMGEGISQAGRPYERGLKLAIPMALPGRPELVVTGATQQSLRIAGMYALLDEQQRMISSSMNHTRYTARRALEELVPQIMREQRLTASAANRMAREFETQLREPLEWVPTLKPGVHKGLDEYIRLRSQMMRLYTPAETVGQVRPLDQFEYAAAIKRGELVDPSGKATRIFPGGSPGRLAKGVVSTVDWGEAAYLVPEATDYGRRPERFLRREFTPTQAALQAMKEDPLTQRFAWLRPTVGGETVGIQRPTERIIYVSSELAPELAGTGVSPEGQTIVSNRRAAMRAVDKLEQFDIASDQLQDLANVIDKDTGGSWTINKMLAKGTTLGKDPEMRPVTLEEDMFLVEARKLQDRNRGEYVKVMAMKEIERQKLMQVAGPTKGMRLQTSQEYLAQVLRERVGMRGPALKDIDTILFIDEFKKQRALHYQQMFSSLWEFTRINMESGQAQAALKSNLERFYTDPVKETARIRKIAFSGDKFAHEKALREIFVLGRQAKLTSAQMGAVFGAVPEVFGLKETGAFKKAVVTDRDLQKFAQEWQQFMMRGAGMSEEQIERTLASRGLEGAGVTQRKAYGLTVAEAETISMRRAGGYGEFFPVAEDVAGGVGRRGPVEPRLIEMLDAPSFGEAGPAIREEMIERMKATYPERIVEEARLTEAMRNLKKPGIQRGALPASELLRGLEPGAIPAKESYMRVRGIGDILIPGQTELSRLAGYQTAGGQVVESQLTGYYREAMETARAYESQEITKDAMRKQLGLLQRRVEQERSLAISGAGGLLRNKLPGSVALRAVEPTMAMAAQLGPGEAGMTQRYADIAFREMEQLYPEEKYPGHVVSMRARFKAGEGLPGLAWRHPILDPRGIQATTIRKVAGDEAALFMHERRLRAITFEGRLEGERLAEFEKNVHLAFRNNERGIKNLQKMGASTLSNPVRSSPLVGFGGDTDGDTVSAMFAGPRLDKSLTSHMSDQTALDLYEQYDLRTQLLKAGKAPAPDDLTIRKAMAGATIKLGVPERGQLGRISATLQTARAGVLAQQRALGKEATADAMWLLRFLEQEPLSSKHIQAGKEVRMINLLQDVQEAVAKKDANAIAESVRAVLAASKTSEDILKEGLTIAMEDLGTGEITTRHLRTFPLEKTAENIANATRAYATADVAKVSAARARQIAMGKTLPTAAEAGALLDPQVLRQLPFSDLFTHDQPSRFARLSSEMLAMKNKMGAAGRTLLEHSRPLAIGGGIALGLATLLSEPPKVLRPDDNIPPRAILKGGTGGANLGMNIHPTPEPAASLMDPDMTRSANTARITGPEDGRNFHRVGIRGTTPGGIDYSSLTNQLRQSLGRNIQINSSIRDQRSSLTPQKLSDIIREG